MQSKYKRRPNTADYAPPEKPSLTFREAAGELGVGITTFFRLEATDPAFPAASRFGPRLKRWSRDDIREYARARRLAAKAVA